MSTITRGAAAIEPSPPSTTTPTVTHYKQLAEDFIHRIDELTASIPNVQPSHELTAGFVRRRQNVPDEFLKTTIAAVEQSPELLAVKKLDPAEANDAVQFIDAFRPVLDRIGVFQKDLRHTIRTRRALLGSDALQIYAIGKGLARDAGSAGVASHVENMGRDLGRARPSKRKAVKPTGGAPAS